MSTNRWKIILDNFPKYFTERIDFLYGVDMVCRLSSHMKAVWEDKTFTDVNIKAVLGAKEKFDEKYTASVEVNTSTALKGNYNNECSVEFNPRTIMNAYGNFVNTQSIKLLTISTLRIYLKSSNLHRLDVDVKSSLLSRGLVNSDSYMTFEIQPLSTIKGRSEQHILMNMSPLGKLLTKGIHNEESYFSTNVIGIVGTFYKVHEHNNKQINDINQTTLFDLCVKNIY